MKPRKFLFSVTRLATPLLATVLTVGSAHANNIAKGTLTAPYFFNTAATGGGDTADVTTIDFDRNLAINTPFDVGPDGTTITIRGISWASAGVGGTSLGFVATDATATITYLGANGVLGGGDDVLIGTATDAVNASTTAGVWAWTFTTPMTALIDGANSQFRINITSNGAPAGTMRFKTTIGGQAQPAANVKLTVAGSTAAYTIPVPLVWNGSTGTSWATATNWTPNQVPGAANLVSFDSSSTTNLNTTLDQNLSVLGIKVGSPTANVSISGANLLSLGASGIDLSAATRNLSISSQVFVENNQTWNVASGQTLTVSGDVGGAANFVKTGPGNLLMSGFNYYTSPTQVNEGKILNGSADQLPIGGTLTATGTGTFDLNGFNATFAQINAGSASGTITNSGATAILSATNVTFSGTTNSLVTGNLAFHMTNANIGNPPFALSSPNTFTGGMVLKDGTNGTRLYFGAPVVTVGSPGAIVSGPFGTGAITIGETVTDKAGFLFQTSDTVLVNDVVFNTAAGFGGGGIINPGIRVDNTGIQLAGQVTANLADATFCQNGGSQAGISLTGKVTGPLGLAVIPATPFPVTPNSFSLSVTLANAAGTNDYAGNTTITSAALAVKTLVLGASNQIPNGVGKGDVVNDGTLDMNTFSETINGLSGAGVVDNTAVGTPVLTVGDNNATSAFTGTIQNTTGTLSVTKTGSGTLTLTGPNAYSGTTIVNGGILATSGASLPDDGTLVINGGKVEVTGTETVSALFFGEMAQTPGTYGALGSGADFPDNTHFSGTAGVINVVPTLVGGYAAWAAINAPGQTPDQDFDNDSVTNGAEYVLGGTKDTMDAGKLPTVATSGGNLTFSFNRDQASIDGATVVAIEVGTTLVTWPDSYPVPAGAVAAAPGVTVVKNTSAGFDTVTLSISQSLDAKKFARLRVTP